MSVFLRNCSPYAKKKIVYDFRCHLISYLQGVRKVLALFKISETNATGSYTYIQKQDKTKAGGNKPRPFANCLLDVAAVGGDDGLDAVAEALAGLDDVGCLQSLPRCHDARLQRLKVGVRGGLDLIL